MTDTILPHALPNALDGRSGVKLLSLDCFDTLLWRDTHAPSDIFHLLPGIAPPQRIWAEKRARRVATLRHRRSEVSIDEIYTELFPNGPDALRAGAVQAELDAEARHCFAFAPTVALMRAAKARGLQVVIVSDTYLDRDQLHALIRDAAGDEVVGLIDKIFCSSDHAVSKGEGLLGVMLRATRMKPAQVLHIGDNPKADYEAARKLGIPALHLRQFTPACTQRLRLEATAGTMVHAGGGAFQPHRATLAAGAARQDDPAAALGHDVLGPVLAPFARWVKAQSDALETRGGQVHRLFLMRDGHLPRRVFDAAFPEAGSHAIELSRFTAIAASLDNEAAVRRYVEAELGNGEPEDLLRQLLFTHDEITTAMKKVRSGDAIGGLIRVALAPERLATTVTRASEYGDRLKAYLRREVNPVPGDTLLLIDLGYNGTVQNHIEPVLRARFGVQVAGAYLLLREQELAGLDKRGFIGPDAYDADTLEAFAANVAVLEQLCTAAQGSVIDYSDDGQPVRSGHSIKARQSETREAAQQGCLAYAASGGDALIRVDGAACEATERTAAAATLARLMFLPQPEELAVLERFEHDVNLGGADTVKLFDRESAATGLKERGLFYLKHADRMYLPAELRGHGLPLNLTLFAQRRFGLDLRYADFCDEALDIGVLLADGRDVTQSSVRAVPTHDGHYLATIPVGAMRYAVGLQFGKRYEWLQILSARFLPVEGFLAEEPVPDEEILEATPSLEGMEQVAPHLFRCNDAAAFLMVPPAAASADGTPMMLAVAFRPLVDREPDAVVAASPNAAERVRRGA